ncbi:magnesium transporter [Halobaculum roseum]|uniref:Magnesium transporter n=1 Tax=Halobaculum roseum TaxID=2175149 RepID=A0ABD5MJ31_9EURY|nr:magnesium transporter [Halobaculum roseum]QZY04328.1 magnesium transporter [Halobaculum roseum]
MSVVSVVTNSYRSALPTVLVSAFGGLLAGTILGGMDAELKAVQGLLVMVPAFLAIRGSVYGSLGSRLSSALHQGLLDPVFEPDDRLVNAVVAALLNGLTASVFAAILTFAILSVIGHAVAPLWVLVFIAFVGGVLAGFVLTAVIVVVVFVGYRRGMNPDDLVGPAMTTAGDIFGMASLFVATKLVLAVL